MKDTRQELEPRPRRWAWRIGSLAGVSIYLHATFLLLLAWIAVSHVGAGHGLLMAGQGLLLIASVFAVVVLHEMGHALVARRFGIATRDITLYPIGGVASLERMPERPAQELLVAIAGPAVNGVLAIAIYLGLRLADVDAREDPLALGGSLAVQLLWVNVSLGLFNLLPAFPMDGGRILRAVLAFRMERTRATVIAARIGRGLAVVMGIVGLLWSPMLAVVAVFVWMSAEQEVVLEQTKTTLRGVAVADAMVSEFQTIAAETSVDAAASRLATGFQHDFPVIEDDRVVGMLTRDDVLRGLALHRPRTPVREIMHERFPIAGAYEQLDDVLGRLPTDGSAIAVFQHDQLVGLLDPAHIDELLAMRGMRPGGLA
ncbi:MAG TPA: site-2 protease family protein [Kofleriaceae bacterium]|nr:site-2 protease family protein [Kofleriaceae bacterium]